MSDVEWRVAHASVIGTSHEKTGLPCQDAGCCRMATDPEGRHVLLAVACDRAGSASRSLDGATLTALLPLLEQKSDGAHLAQAREHYAEVRNALYDRSWQR